MSDPDKYERFITKDLGDGVHVILGFYKEGKEEKSEPQAFRFDKDVFKDKASVKKWLKEHDIKNIQEFVMAEKEDKEKQDSAADDETIKENEIVSRKGEVYQEIEPIDEKSEEPADVVVIKEVVSDNKPEFNIEKARRKLVEWATSGDGTISKKALLKWFLDVDGGDAQSVDSYRYPVGYVVNGNPEYCVLSLDGSWDLASGKQTGVANRGVQKKIIFIKRREGLPLNEEQMDFTVRHMSSGEPKYHVLENENSSGGIDLVPDAELKLNSSPAGSKIIYEDDEVVDVPVVPMREGVFTGTDGIPTLKKFEYFGKDAHWLEGQPILRGHTAPTELVTYKHNRIGKIINVIPRPDKKDVVAIARYYKEKLSPEDLTRIKSGVPYDGSIAYTTHTTMAEGQYNGQKYDAIEDGGYHFYHFAELPDGRGACSTKDGCGFMMNGAEVAAEVKEPIIENAAKEEESPISISLNENYWTAPVKSHILVLSQKIKDLESKSDPSLSGEIKKLKDEVARWKKQLEKLNPQQNSAPDVNTIKQFYNETRKAMVDFSGDGYEIRLNSSGGFGTLKTSDRDQAMKWAKIYVGTGKIPASMRSNYNCITKEQKQNGIDMTDYDKYAELGIEKADADTLADAGITPEMLAKESPADEGTGGYVDTVANKYLAGDLTIDDIKAKFGIEKPAEETGEYVEPEKEMSGFEEKLKERDAKIEKLTAMVNDLMQKQNAAQEALISEKAAKDFEAFVQKLNAKARQDAKVHYEGFKAEGWAYFEKNPILRQEIPKQNAKGISAGEGDNASGLQAARELFRKNQKERFGKKV